MKKIALIGSAPSSVQLAPYSDPSWTIWACSPGARPFVSRVDAWFELHRREPGKPWFQPDYVGFLASLKCPVYVAEQWPEWPTSVIYPKDEMLKEFGPYFFTSSLSYMFAMAIMEGATEIGLWGVDMSAQEEWSFQRSGCHFFIWEARRRGIQVTLPPESDLWVPPPMYGFQEVNPHHVKLLKRKEELTHRLQMAQQQVAHSQREVDFLQGAIDDNEYHIKTWVQDGLALKMAISGPTHHDILAKWPEPPADPQPVNTAKIAGEITNLQTVAPGFFGEPHHVNGSMADAHVGELTASLPAAHRSE